MNIVYVANEAYVSILGTSLYSLYENNKDAVILDVYIIQTGISEGSVKLLEDLAGYFQRSINIINFEDIRQKKELDFVENKFDISVMARLFADELLPEDVKRVLYIDCDTLVLKSLQKLFFADLGEKTIGAVPEPTINIKVKKSIGIDVRQMYFNSGVLLIDLNKYREKKFRKRILAYYDNIKESTIFSDQDAINGALCHHIKVLSPRYNFFANYRYWSYKALINYSPSYGIIPEKVYQSAKKDPVILHFAGDERPWYEGNLNPYKKLYKSYQNKTPWRGISLKTRSRLYLGLYHLMNVMTLFCPKIRIKISDEYIKRLYR